MTSFFTSALKAGLRSRSFHAVFILGLLLIAAAYLAALFSLRQPETIALDVGISGMRFSAILLGLFWVQDLVGKEIDRKTITLYLAYPIPRYHYVLGRFWAIAVLLFIACTILGLLLWLTVITASHTYEQAHQGSLGIPYWATIVGLWLDTVIVMSFSLCIATLSTTPALPLVLGMAFALASHGLGTVIDYLTSGAGGQQDLVAQFGPIVDVIRWVMPDLSRLDWREWPMYGQPPPSGYIELSVLMGGGYLILLLLITFHSFRIRDFD